MRLHFIPVGDFRDGKRFYHAASERCECNPLKEVINSHGLFIHNAFDLRERWERLEVWHEAEGWVIIEEL